MREKERGQEAGREERWEREREEDRGERMTRGLLDLMYNQ